VPLVPAALLSLSLLPRNFHQHNQVVEPVFGPTSEPTHLPVAEPGAQRHFGAKAKEFRFQLHVVFCPSFVHTLVPLRRWNSKSDRQGSSAGREGATSRFSARLFCLAASTATAAAPAAVPQSRNEWRSVHSQSERRSWSCPALLPALGMAGCFSGGPSCRQSCLRSRQNASSSSLPVSGANRSVPNRVLPRQHRSSDFNAAHGE